MDGGWQDGTASQGCVSMGGRAAPRKLPNATTMRAPRSWTTPFDAFENLN